MSKEYDEGYDAVLEEKTYEYNPYKKGTKKHMDWEDGHHCKDCIEAGITEND